jgi:hypothetical protein
MLVLEPILIFYLWSTSRVGRRFDGGGWAPRSILIFYPVMSECGDLLELILLWTELDLLPCELCWLRLKLET